MAPGENEFDTQHTEFTLVSFPHIFRCIRELTIYLLCILVSANPSFSLSEGGGDKQAGLERSRKDWYDLKPFMGFLRRQFLMNKFEARIPEENLK